MLGVWRLPSDESELGCFCPALGRATRAQGDSAYGDTEVAQLVAGDQVIPRERGRMLHTQAVYREQALQEDIRFLERSVGAWAPVRPVAEAEQLRTDSVSMQLAIWADRKRILSHDTFIGIGGMDMHVHKRALWNGDRLVAY